MLGLRPARDHGRNGAPLAIYGMLSYVLTPRTRETGIRIALGAQQAQVKRMLLGHVLVLVGVGVALGLGGAAPLTRLMESQFSA